MTISGRVGLDNESIATEMIKAFEEFANDSPSCVNDIRIVVYDARLFPVIKRKLFPELDVGKKFVYVETAIVVQQTIDSCQTIVSTK